MIGKIIGTIIFARSLIEVKLALTNAIFNLKETHIHRFSTALLDCVSKNADDTLVIDHDGSSGLRMSHFDQSLANDPTLFAVRKYRRNLGFGGGRYDVRKNLTYNMNGSIPR